jgi:hypothetical protein
MCLPFSLAGNLNVAPDNGCSKFSETQGKRSGVNKPRVVSQWARDDVRIFGHGVGRLTPDHTGHHHPGSAFEWAIPEEQITHKANPSSSELHPSTVDSDSAL